MASDEKGTATAGRGPRSPNFPAIGLSDAITKARVLYEKDKRSLVSHGTILSHLGFGAKLSGSTARVISALRQFGLLEEEGGQLRVTEAATRLFTLSDSSPERLRALQECARKPAIYREILQHYADGLPSDAALSDYLLLAKKFNPASTDTFIRVFKASLEFAKISPGAYDASDSGGSDRENMATETHKPRVAGSSTHAPAVFSGGGSGHYTPSERTYCWPLPNGVIAEVRFTGDAGVTHFDFLQQYLELAKRAVAIEDSAGAPRLLPENPIPDGSNEQ